MPQTAPWLGRVGEAGTGLKVLASAGVIRPFSPLTLARLGRTVARWGVGPAGGFTTLAVRFPRRIGLVDERGELTFSEMHARSNALAHALRTRGVGEGDAVAVMVRNHRGFVDAVVAIAKLGADILLLNTAFAGPQLIEVLDREQPALVIYDEEFEELLAGADVPERVVSWTDEEGVEGSAEHLIGSYPTDDLAPPRRHARIVILTSGTTGTPKGAPRNEAGVDAGVALLERMPIKAGMRHHIAAPLFHTWGFAHLALGMLLGTTAVLHRRFDPETCLQVVTEHDCEAVAVIPVMLQRILALPDDVLDRYDLSRVACVAASGSALPGDLALAWMDRFGDHLYNTYGSTEVAYGAIATPHDLREAPGTAGRPPLGTVVRIIDDRGRPVPTGEPGRIFVGNSLLFEGYTGGGDKERIDGLMSSGDVGRLDEQGRLFVEGRDDEMIISGGENVFPQEVENCLVRHDAVLEAAALGVDDADFGQRLRAFVVLHEGAEASEEDLRGWVRDHLARFKVPRDFVFLDELPRNATGKVLKVDLLEKPVGDA